MTPPFDPITFSMHSTVAWVRLWQAQHEAWLRCLCAMTATMPHETSAELAAEAEKMRAAAARKPSAPRAKAASRSTAAASSREAAEA